MDNDIKLIHGECLVEMKNIPDKSIDMILCDLPYGTTACKWDSVIPFDKLWEEYKRIRKEKSEESKFLFVLFVVRWVLEYLTITYYDKIFWILIAFYMIDNTKNIDRGEISDEPMQIEESHQESQDSSFVSSGRW